MRKIVLALLGIVLLFVGEPRRETHSPWRLDQGWNGIWIGHQWYTGRNVRTGKPVPAAERRALIERLRAHGIRYAFLHAGPIQADGSIRDRPGPELQALLREAPDILFLPWLGTDVRKLDLESPAWRNAFVQTVDGLRQQGFRGVHLDIEPLPDGHAGYLALLADLRSAFGPGFLLSHATRRAGPFGFSAGPLKGWFWSEEFHRETMTRTDQTVLMAYDTTLDTRWLYVRFVRHETGLLLDWACESPGHRVLIGIPSYEDVPRISNPRVENIPNALQGVRDALSDRGGPPPCFEGISVYSEWVTSPMEWRQLREGGIVSTGR